MKVTLETMMTPQFDTIGLFFVPFLSNFPDMLQTKQLIGELKKIIIKRPDDKELVTRDISFN